VSHVGLVMTVAQGFLVRRFAGRTSESAMAVGGTLVSTLSLILLSVAVQRESYGLLCLAMAVFVIGLAFVTPSLQSLISRRTSPERQGHVLGVTQSLSSFARIAGPVLGIRLFACSPQVPLWSAAAIMALAALLTISAVRSGRDFGG
jgi:predicted MFS family arabinose efflux permease